MALLRCQAMIVSVSAAGLGLITASDGELIKRRAINLSAILTTCRLVILLLRTWAYALAAHSPSS